MEKVYLQNGTEQDDPFELDDLKVKNIYMKECTNDGIIDELKKPFSPSTHPQVVSMQAPDRFMRHG